MNLTKLLMTIALVTIIIIVFSIMNNYLPTDIINFFLSLINNFGPYAILGFILFYATATIIMIPGGLMTFLGGLLFGPYLGFICNLVGATFGAIIALLTARYLTKSLMATRLNKYTKQIQHNIDNQGWKFIAISRLMPFLPFNLINYAFGLTNIKVTTFAWASIIFMSPGCFAYTYLGSLGQSALTGELRNNLDKIFISIGILVFIACIPWCLKTRFRIKK